MTGSASLVPFCRRVACCLLVIGLAACTKWSTVTAPTPEKPLDGAVTYRVTTLRDGIVHEMTAVFLRNDSLLGISTERYANVPIGVPVTDIKSIERKRVDGVATIALLGAVTVVIATAAAATMDDLGGGWGGGGNSGGQVVSCPLIYSWDGHDWRLDSGTFGGAITPALARTDMDNLLHARPFGGLLRFRMTAEADETEHVDAISVLAVDHPHGTTVAPDARANTTFHVVRDLAAPIAARDRRRPDVLAQLAAADGVVWEPRLDGRDPANPADLRDGIELTFVRPAGDRLQLVIDGQNTTWAAQLMGEMVAAHGHLTAAWYDPATTVQASAPMARAQREQGFLTVSLWNGTSWQSAGQVWEAGPEVAKRQVLPIDVRGIPGPTLRVRLESAPAMWSIDHVALGEQVEVAVTTRPLVTTMVHSTTVPDAMARLAAADGRMFDMERGDVAEFTVRDAAPPARGMTRSYLLRSSGWYRVHGRDREAPIAATLTGLAQPDGAARLAVMRLNEALAAVTRGAQHVARR